MQSSLPREVATGVRFGEYALLAFGEIPRRQMASFDVGGSVYWLWSLGAAERCISVFEVCGKLHWWSVRVGRFA